MAKRNSDTLLELPDIRKDDPKLAALLREAHSLRDAERRLKEVRKEIGEICSNSAYSGGGKLGFRAGPFAAIIRWQDGRKTFSRELAVEHGVPPDILDLCFKQGEGGWVVELDTITD